VRRLTAWPAIATAIVVGGLLLDGVGLPSSYLFAALLVGLATALLRPGGSVDVTTFVVAVQSLRVIAMVLLAPLAVRWTLDRASSG